MKTIITVIISVLVLTAELKADCACHSAYTCCARKVKDATIFGKSDFFIPIKPETGCALYSSEGQLCNRKDWGYTESCGCAPHLKCVTSRNTCVAKTTPAPPTTTTTTTAMPTTTEQPKSEKELIAICQGLAKFTINQSLKPLEKLVTMCDQTGLVPCLWGDEQACSS